MTASLESKLKHYRLNQSEYQRICDLLGREPQGVEWAIFSALWSEHCSYKSSRVHLKKLFRDSPRVVQSFGENAGVVDLGQGERVAFKMESHNHPSFIEPYQGAATGVGGILRDIFTMGARPVALANYLCFGEPNADRMTALVDGVVRGIAGYGNCVGVPNITGQTEFHSSYNGNILVNALAVGLFGPQDQIFLSQAQGEGNYVVYVGAKTGRDGVHGASMASESFDEDSESKRPTVQIGDPFYEKLLIESCLEVMKENLVVAIQDMGAAGLTSSSFEMAAKGGVGLVMHLDRVPLRDSSLTPEDILLSESQERMLLICRPDQFDRLASVFHRWDLDAVVIGEVQKKKTIDLFWKGELLTSIDPNLVVEESPAYERAFKPWKKAASVSAQDIEWPAPKNMGLDQVLNSAIGGSKSWIYRQYDQRVGTQTIADCSDPVGAIRLPYSGRALGLALGCRPHVMRWDAFWGGVDSIAYPALELALKGFEPLAVTDCLNFGNPEKEGPMSEFVAALDGMNQMCQTAKTPIISGNVSFYNETQGKNVTSTPSTGLIGLREDVNLPKSSFMQDGQQVFLVEFDGGKHWLAGRWFEQNGQALRGAVDLNLQLLGHWLNQMRSLCLDSRVKATRAVGQFGLLYTLSRMTMNGVGLGVQAELNAFEFLREPLYGAILVIDGKESLSWIQDALPGSRVTHLGVTGGKSLKVSGSEWSVDQLKSWYAGAWEKNFESLA